MSTMSEWIGKVFRPLFGWYIAVEFYVRTAVEMLLHNRKDFSAGNVRKLAFARLWNMMSYSEADGLKDTTAEPLAPLLPEYVKGCVLELGPGNGVLLRYLDASKIEAMYGVEPTTAFNPVLSENAHDAGLCGKFHILNRGGEAESLIPALNDMGLLDGSSEAVFDTIVCVRVLCSIKNQKESIEELYRLLKPGGCFVILEHVANPWPGKNGNLIGWAMQRLIMGLGWSYFMGDCRLTCDTENLIMHAANVDGGWADQGKLRRRGDDTPMPWIHGVLRKK